MALAKFFEDNIKIYNDHNYPDGYTVIKPIKKVYPKIRLKTYLCPICLEKFFEAEEMNRHIYKTHHSSFYIKVDSFIADPVTELEEIPNSITLHNSSSGDTINLEVRFCGVNLKKIEIGPQKEFEIDATYIRTGVIEIKNLSNQKEYSIYIKSLPKFDIKKAEDILNRFSVKFVALKENRSAEKHEWNDFWKEFKKELDTVEELIEKRYIKGIFEFMFAIYKDEIVNTKDSKRHYENAEGFLHQFTNNQITTVLRALAFKMNNYSKFINLNKESIFYCCELFFTKEFGDIKSIIEKKKDQEFFNEIELQKYILLDFKNWMLFNAIRKFLQGDIDQTQRMIDQLDELSKKEAFGSNFMEKFYLLKGRVYRILGKNEAKKYYNNLMDMHIKNAPFYNEVILYLKN